MELGASSHVLSGYPLQNLLTYLTQWMDLWEKGKFVTLVNDYCNEVCMQTISQKHQTFEVKARRYNTLGLDGRLRLVVRSVTYRDDGGILVPEAPCTKDDTKLVREVLAAKNPNLDVLDLSDAECMCFKPYPVVPMAIPINTSSDAAMKMAPRLSGGAGPSGIDAVALR